MENNQVLIQFSDNTQMNEFLDWFRIRGFDQMLKSEITTITCLSADDEQDYGYYLEME